MNARANSSDGSFSEPFDASEVVEPPGDLVEHGSSCLADNSAMVDESGIAGDFDRENLQKRYSVQRENAKYPADCYSFLSIHGPFEQPKFFAFGVIIWLFQVRTVSNGIIDGSTIWERLEYNIPLIVFFGFLFSSAPFVHFEFPSSFYNSHSRFPFLS